MSELERDQIVAAIVSMALSQRAINNAMGEAMRLQLDPLMLLTAEGRDAFIVLSTLSAIPRWPTEFRHWREDWCSIWVQLP